MLAAAGQLHHLLQCLHPIGIARARRAPAGLPTGRRDQASEPGKLEACKPLRGLQLPGYRRWGRPPGIGQSLGGPWQGSGAGLSGIWKEIDFSVF